MTASAAIRAAAVGAIDLAAARRRPPAVLALELATGGGVKQPLLYDGVRTHGRRVSIRQLGDPERLLSRARWPWPTPGGQLVMEARPASSRPRMVISARAFPGRYGAGVNLRDVVQATREVTDLQVFASAEYSGVPSHRVPPSVAASAIGRVPFVRRLTDWHELLVARSFDGHVAARLPPADIVHAEAGSSLRTLRAARRAGARLVLDCITTHVDNVVAQQRREGAVFGTRPQINAPAHRLRLAEYEEADLLRVPSRLALRTFAERGVASERVVVVPPLVSPEEFPPARFDQGCFRVCFAGRLVPVKGFHYLVEAYESLGLPDAELELWGGPTSRPVARYLAEHARRTPSLSVRPEWAYARPVGEALSDSTRVQASYAEAFGRASVLVHPSVADTFGYVVAEAMACGIPAIVTDQTGAAELVRDGVSGYVVPARDTKAIAERLRHLYDHPELLPRMGAEARRAVGDWTPTAFRDHYVRDVLGLDTASATP